MRAIENLARVAFRFLALAMEKKDVKSDLQELHLHPFVILWHLTPAIFRVIWLKKWHPAMRIRCRHHDWSEISIGFSFFPSFFLYLFLQASRVFWQWWRNVTSSNWWHQSWSQTCGVMGARPTFPPNTFESVRSRSFLSAAVTRMLVYELEFSVRDLCWFPFDVVATFRWCARELFSRSFLLMLLPGFNVFLFCTANVCQK